MTSVPEDSALGVLQRNLDKGGAVGDVLHRRLSPLSGGATLAVVGESHGITRERVRQLQVQLEKLIAVAADEPEVLEVAGRFRDHFGPAVPLGTTPPLAVTAPLTDHGWIPADAVAVALVATGWARAGTWCLHPDVPTLPEAGDEDQCRRLVAHLGRLLGPGLAEQVVAGAVRQKNRQPPDIGDLIELVLAGAYRPLTTAEIAAHDPGGRSVSYVDNVLSADERFVRLSRDAFGLTTWGLPPYLGVAEAMARAIEAGGGRARLVDLAADLHAQYGHATASVSIYASSTLMFITSNGWVRRRPPEQYIEAAIDPEDDPLCWKDDQGRWAIAFAVDHDLLRGSGLSVSPGFAGVVGCPPGGSAEVLDDHGLPVTITWSERGTSAPAISSLRPIAEALGATDSQRITLAWDAAASRLVSAIETSS